MKQTAPNNKKKGRVPTPFLSECQIIAALVLESGCKSSMLRLHEHDDCRRIDGFKPIRLSYTRNMVNPYFSCITAGKQTVRKAE